MDNKVPQQINDIVGDNVKKLAQLFPSAVKDGEVDFEALKEELGQFEEAGSEKYELTWAGKKNAKKIAQEDVIGRTLKFIPEDSKNADTTENLYIEGDNLEVLKLLRQNYYGAIKMIYIEIITPRLIQFNDCQIRLSGGVQNPPRGVHFREGVCIAQESNRQAA